MKRLSGLVLAVLVFPALAMSQVPSKLGYQGRLLKSDGSPEAGVVDLTFALFANSGGGSHVWTESQKLGLADGFYAAALGEVTTLSPSLFDGRDLFLEVSIGGAALSPRHQVGSVAYAMTAANLKGGTVDATAIKVGGKTVIDSSGKLEATAYATSPSSGLSVGSDNALSLTTACAAGQILKWSGAAWQCAADGGNTYDAGSGLALNGSTFSLATTCALGQILKWSGGAWQCAADGGNSYDAGSGLALNGSTFSLLPGCTLGQLPTWSGTKWECADVTANPAMQSVSIANLLRNGDLELWNATNTAATFWTDYGSATARAITKVGGYFNASSVRFSDVDLSATAALQQVVYAVAPPSLAGQVVTLSVWSKWSAGAGAGKICVADAGPAESETSMTCQKLASNPGSSAWAKTVVTHTVSGTPAYLKVILHPTTTPPEAAAYLFDGAMLVVGTYQGTFSPSITEQIYEGGVTAAMLAGVAVTAPLIGGGTAAAPLAMPSATATRDGFLRGADFSAFTEKMTGVTVSAPLVSSGGTAPTLSLTTTCASGQILRWNGSAWACSANATGVTASAPLASSGGETPNLTLAQASGSANGFLASADWTTFNNRISAVTAADTSINVAGTLPARTVAVNTSVIQARVSGTCAAGSPVRAINADGTVVCDLPAPLGIAKAKADARANCQAIKVAGDTGDGLYWIDPNGGSTADAFQAWCDMTISSGGWTLAMTVNPSDGNNVSFFNTAFWLGTSEYGRAAEAVTNDYKSPAAWMISATAILVAIHDPTQSATPIGWKAWNMGARTYNSFFTGGQNATQTSSVIASDVTNVYAFEAIIRNGNQLQSNRNINPNADRIRLGVDGYSAQGDDNQPGLGTMMNEAICTNCYRFRDVELWVNSNANLWCSTPGAGSFKWIGGDGGCGWSCGGCDTAAGPAYSQYWLYRIYVR